MVLLLLLWRDWGALHVVAPLESTSCGQDDRRHSVWQLYAWSQSTAEKLWTIYTEHRGMVLSCWRELWLFPRYEC